MPLPQRGRVALCLTAETQTQEADVEVFAVPGHWGEDDLERWCSVAMLKCDSVIVTAIQPIEL